MSGKSLEEEIKIKAQEAKRLARYMSSTQDLVERQIEQAMARGEFDNLAGKGKPLDLEDNPFEPLETRMMMKILKDNDFAPYWIELGKEIDARWEKLNKETEVFKSYTRMTLGQKRSKSAVQRYEQKKASFYSETRYLLEDIYRKTLDYNLHCPTYRQGRANITVDDEIMKVICHIESYTEELLKTIKE